MIENSSRLDHRFLAHRNDPIHIFLKSNDYVVSHAGTAESASAGHKRYGKSFPGGKVKYLQEVFIGFRFDHQCGFDLV